MSVEEISLLIWSSYAEHWIAALVRSAMASEAESFHCDFLLIREGWPLVLGPGRCG
jgi:hypothetical protein